MPRRERSRSLSEHEQRAIDEFSRHFGITFHDPALLKLALTHRSYLSVTGQGPRESNERLEFLGDSVLGLVTSEFLYRQHPNEHEGHLTKIKSLLVSKAILSRRALAMGLGRFVLMSHSEIESGGRQRLSILADAFEAVLGSVYLDQGFEAARSFIEKWLLRDSRAITSDERHVNYKSHLQEYVQSTYHTHPVYRIRSEYGPDHSKHFNVDVMVGRRVLGSGKGRNKKEAEQAAARGALDQAGALPRIVEHPYPSEFETQDAAPIHLVSPADEGMEEAEETLEESEEIVTEGVEGRRSRRRGRRGGRGRRSREGGREIAAAGGETAERTAGIREARATRVTAESGANPEPTTGTPAPIRPRVWRRPDDEFEEIGRPEGPLEERHVDPYDWETRGSESTAPPPAAAVPHEREAIDVSRSLARSPWMPNSADERLADERLADERLADERLADERLEDERLEDEPRGSAPHAESAAPDESFASAPSAEARAQESHDDRESESDHAEEREVHLSPEIRPASEGRAPAAPAASQARPEIQFGRRGSRTRSRPGAR
ncbi:MAG: ribonuclease III [Candidatus Eiseniibacteriota bacterium]